MKKEDLKAGYLVESNKGLQVLMPISYNGNETLALVSDLNSPLCQQILNYDPFVKENVKRVWGLPTSMDVWLKISIKFRPLLWECKEDKKTVTLELTDEQLEKIKAIIKENK